MKGDQVKGDQVKGDQVNKKFPIDFWYKYYNDNDNNIDEMEWYCEYGDIKSAVETYIGDKKLKILEIGCGISKMAIEMINDSKF